MKRLKSRNALKILKMVVQGTVHANPRQHFSSLSINLYIHFKTMLICIKTILNLVSTCISMHL